MPNAVRPAAILIAGPTASGKSAVALRLAGRLGGVVINTDSMQLYRDLRVLTARPTPEEEARAPHRLFGTVDAGQSHSVGLWLADAAVELDSARKNGRVPIFVGGTGLYFKALTQGISAIPTVPADLREKLRAETAGLPPDALHARLAVCDPIMAARLRPTDPQRLLRALEVFASTGKSLASFQGARQPALLDSAACRAIFLAPDRAALNARIDARFDAMLAHGALDEVAALAARHLDPALPAMRAHGVPHLIRALRGEIALGAAAETGKRDTRQYAKRQFTFARHQLPAFAWVAPDAADGTVLREAE